MFAGDRRTPTECGPRAVCPEPRADAAVRLVCLPYAGGGVAVFRGWQRALPASVEVRAIELPGRGSQIRCEPFTRLEPLVDATAEALAPLLDRPLAIFGHSMGALVGFELSRSLSARFGVEPVHLYVAAHPAPQLPSRAAPVHALPEAEFREELRRMNGTSPEVLANAELMDLVSPVLRADFEVCETYEHARGAPLACPITAFGGEQDAEVDRASLEAWDAQTRAGAAVHMLPGDHFFVQSERATLLAAFGRDLGGRAATSG